MKKETDELNEKILESARSEFLAYGYQDASLRRICRAAGLTTGALYKRYESKMCIRDSARCLCEERHQFDNG